MLISLASDPHPNPLPEGEGIYRCRAYSLGFRQGIRIVPSPSGRWLG